MRQFAAIVSAALVATAPAAWAEPAAEWLLKISEAARQSNYQGVVVYRDARSLEVLRIAHRNQGGQVQERLTSLTGQPRDILREGDRVACVTARGGVESAGGIPQRLFPALSAQTLGETRRYYEVRDLGEARVAGRACRGVALAPRDEFRYGYEFCADRDTAVPLRVALLDPRGRVVEQLMFTEVAFPQRIPDTAFSTPVAAPATAPAEQVVETSAPGSWQLAQLPPGFRAVMRSQRPHSDGRGLVEHVLLSDGLSSVSVFGAPSRASDASLAGLTRMGALNAYSRTVGAYQVTVVGEVPQGTVRLIGDGVRAPGEAARAN